MPGSYPHPRSRPVSLHRASQWILRGSGTAIHKTVGSARPFLPVVVLIIASALCSCTAEPPATPAGSQATATPVAPAAGPTGNHPPSVLSARIYPEDVTLDTELRVDLHGEDLDGDRITYRYQWVVNEVPAAGATVPVFRPERLKKGDRVTAEIVPTDGKADGEVFTTGPVTIGNTAPSIREIYVDPLPLQRGKLIKVRVVASDPDGDPVSLTYKWFRNNKAIPDAKSDTLDTKEFQKKDILEVLVTPSDGKSTREGQGVQMLIENSPPRFTSTPPTEIKDGQYLYQVAVTDPDEDPVTLELKQGPPGMALDPATKQLSWKLTPENLGKHHVVLVAKDNDNGSTQVEFDLDALPPKP